MATRDFLMMAAEPGATVDTQADYAGSGYQENGFQPGMTLPVQFNKGFRQGTAGMAVLAQFIINVLNVNVLDSGDASEAAEVTRLAGLLETALTAYIAGLSVAAITALTGPVTAAGPGSVAATITPTGVTAGSYNGPITVNAAGQVTAAALINVVRTSKTGTYVAGETYTNSTGAAVCEEVMYSSLLASECTGVNAYLTASVDGVVVASCGVSNECQGTNSMSFWVPAGSTFEVVYRTLGSAPSSTTVTWTEVSFTR
jgi:hypothetical protein